MIKQCQVIFPAVLQLHRVYQPATSRDRKSEQSYMLMFFVLSVILTFVKSYYGMKLSKLL